MATYRFTGPVRWAKVHTPDKKYEHYSIEMKVDADAYENTGLSGGPSKDGEGYYTFRRKPDALVWKNKQQVPAGKPIVVDASGAPTTQLIGNGSVCTVEITVYDYDNKFGKGKGHRLESVRIDELVEYVPPTNDDNLGANF